jgi:hypothetical protein
VQGSDKVKRERMIVYVLLAGGLGNQLFQYSAAASMNPSKIIFVDLIANQRVSANGEPDILNFQLPITVEFKKYKFNFFIRKVFWTFLGSSSSDSKIRKRLFLNKFSILLCEKLLNVILKDKFKLFVSKANGFSTLPNKKNIHKYFFIGYFQSYLYAQKLLPHKKSITLINPSVEAINFYKHISVNKFNSSVQLRGGDYLVNPSFGSLSVDYIKTALSKNVDKSQKIMIFSDDKKLIANFQNRIAFISEIAPEYLSPAETLEAMRKMKTYVISNSTFGWWGAFLSECESPLVIAPEPWFRSKVTPEYLIPPNWATASSIFAGPNA